MNFLLLVLAVFAVIIGIGIATYFIISKRISVPAGRISRSMQEYVTDGELSATKLEVTGDDEFAMIASAFNSMTDDIAYYIESTEKLTQGIDSASSIVLDLSKVEYISSAGLRQVVACSKKAKELGASFSVINAGEQVMSIFVLTGLDKKLNISAI